MPRDRLVIVPLSTSSSGTLTEVLGSDPFGLDTALGQLNKRKPTADEIARQLDFKNFVLSSIKKSSQTLKPEITVGNLRNLASSYLLVEADLSQSEQHENESKLFEAYVWGAASSITSHITCPNRATIDSLAVIFADALETESNLEELFVAQKSEDAFELLSTQVSQQSMCDQ